MKNYKNQEVGVLLQDTKDNLLRKEIGEALRTGKTIILVGPPNTGKRVAIRRAKELIKELEQDLT